MSLKSIVKKVIYCLSIIAFIIQFFYQDTYEIINPSEYTIYLKKPFSISSPDVISAISLNITIVIGVVGFAIALLSITISRSKVSIKDYFKFVTKENNIIFLLCINGICFIITLCCLYIRYTLIVDIWLKLSILPSFQLIIEILINMQIIEQKDVSIKLLTRKLLRNEKDIIGYFKNIISKCFKEDEYDILYESMNSAIDKKADKNILYSINNQILGEISHE